MDSEILKNLKDGPEQQLVVGPLVEILVSKGWNLKQIIFGKKEWKVPKTPSETSKREAGRSFAGFPVDIAVFDSVENANDYRHLLFIIECKKPGIEVGQEQLETYLSLEPHAKLGVVANNAEKGSKVAFVYKDKNGINFPQERTINDLPGVNGSFEPDAVKFTYNNLIIPSKSTLYLNFGALLDNVVSRDGFVTRREQQLDQLCNLLLLKLDSDKLGKDTERLLYQNHHQKNGQKRLHCHSNNIFPVWQKRKNYLVLKQQQMSSTTSQVLVPTIIRYY